MKIEKSFAINGETGQSRFQSLEHVRRLRREAKEGVLKLIEGVEVVERKPDIRLAKQYIL